MNLHDVLRARTLVGLILHGAVGLLAGGCAVVDAGNAVAGVANQVTGSIDSAATVPGKASASASTQHAPH
jgi:hypothetical protein